MMAVIMVLYKEKGRVSKGWQLDWRLEGKEEKIADEKAALRLR
jgi:hypothetical protein